LKNNLELIRIVADFDVPEESEAYLPFFWAPESDGVGGPPVEDPLTIYVQIGEEIVDHAEGFQDEHTGLPVYSLSLRNCVDELIGDFSTPGGSVNKIDLDHLRKFSHSLRQFAEEVSVRIEQLAVAKESGADYEEMHTQIGREKKPMPPEAIADLLGFVVKMAVECECDEADLHCAAIEILKRHGIKTG
jgi:hypothetical protein